ncbi:MAG: hypothetical protein Fur0018_13170 [Anaerolineales bacterium]
MFPQPELSSNLEWLLQSPQATPDALALAVWEACGQHLLRLGAALFGEDHAQTFVTQAVAACLLQADAYRAEMPPCAWVLRMALQAARRLADAQHRTVEAAFLGAARRLGYEKEALEALWDASPRRFRGAWQDAALPGETIVPLGVRTVKGEAAPSKGESVSRLLGGADSLMGAASPGDIPIPDFLRRAVCLAQAEQSRRQRRLRLREAILVLLAAAFILTGLRIGQVLDPYHETPVATQVVVKVQPTPVVVTVIPTPIARYPQKPVFWRVQPGDSLPALAQRFNVSVDDLLAWNHLDDPKAALEAGQLVVVQAAAESIQVAVLGVFPNAPTPLPPLPASAGAAEVLDLMAHSEASWRTLWADAFIADYGPQGYTGAPRITRQQVWVTKDGRSLVLSGGVGDFNPAALFKTVDHPSDDVEALPANLYLREVLFPARYLLAETPPLRIVGRTQAAGRDAVQVDVIRPGGVRETWWVDMQSGLLLRRQVFSRRGVLLTDVQVNRLYLNFIPEGALFDPDGAPGRFAASPRGEPETLQARPTYQAVVAPPGHMPLAIEASPPPGFDFAAAHLTFQWDTWPEPLLYETDVPKVQVQVFADERYRLSPVEIPWDASCARGAGAQASRLFFLYNEVNWMDKPPFGHLAIYDDSSIRYIHTPLFDPAVPPTGFLEDNPMLYARPWLAVSPDGNTVYLAADSSVEGMGIYAVNWQEGGWWADEHTRWIRRIFPAFHTGPLALSPSGTQLAWLEYRDTDTWELVLADLESEEIISRQVVTIPMAADGMPVRLPNVWGKPFPWPQPGVWNCEDGG